MRLSKGLARRVSLPPSAGTCSLATPFLTARWSSRRFALRSFRRVRSCQFDVDMPPPGLQPWVARSPVYQDKKRAIREHCKRCHKKHTPRSLSFLGRKGRPQPKRGDSKQQTDKHQRVRETKYATHDVFTHRPEHWSKSERGCVVFCRTCLAHLQHEAKNVRQLTCDQRLERLRNNPHVRMHKRSWWIRLRDENPQEMTRFLAASGLTQDAIEDLVFAQFDAHASPSCLGQG